MVQGQSLLYQTSNSQKKALQAPKNKQRKDEHLEVVQVTGAINLIQVLCCHMRSYEVCPPAKCPPQLKAMGVVTHSTCCWMEGKEELASSEPRYVGNLIKLLVSIRNIPKMFHR